MIPVNEVSRLHSLLTFELNFQQLECSSTGAPREQAFTVQQQPPRRKITFNHSRVPHLQVLASKAGERAGPGLKSAQAITNFLRGQAKIDLAIFLLEQRCTSGLRMILRLRMQCPGL